MGGRYDSTPCRKTKMSGVNCLMQEWIGSISTNSKCLLSSIKSILRLTANPETAIVWGCRGIYLKIGGRTYYHSWFFYIFNFWLHNPKIDAMKSISTLIMSFFLCVCFSSNAQNSSHTSLVFKNHSFLSNDNIGYTASTSQSVKPNLSQLGYDRLMNLAGEDPLYQSKTCLLYTSDAADE